MSAESATDDVLALCRGAGFALAGIADPAPIDRRRERADWLAAGRHGSMAWLAETEGVRANPSRFLPGARSLVMVGDLYAHRSTDQRDAEPGPEPAPARGRVARYARGDDYHTVMKRRLHGVCDALRERFPAEQFRAFVDTAPLAERDLAARAGLGWVGKHTLLIHPKLGSFFFLGGFATTLALSPSPAQAPVADHCGTCTRCIDACPTGAITPYAVDARRCISYLTIEHRGPIDEEFHSPMGDWLYGCDACQDACPHNRAPPRRADTADEAGDAQHIRVRQAYQPRRDAFDLLDVLGWDEQRRRMEFERSAMKRANLSMMKRNAVIAAANNLARRDDTALRQRLESIAADPAEDPLVRETAATVGRPRPSPGPGPSPCGHDR